MEHAEEEFRAGVDLEVKHDDDEEAAAARVQELKKSLDVKVSLRQNNLNPERPDSGFLKTLDSSIERNTAVIKKLKQINEEQREGLLDELRSVNLSNYISEAVTAICEAKLRSGDIPAAVQICSLLHQRYKEFSQSLVQALLKVFFPGKSVEDQDADTNLKAMKKHSTLKLLLELFFTGVFEDCSILVNIIKDITSAEHIKDRDVNLSLLASFARQGRSLIGLSLMGQDDLEEFFKSLNVTAEQKKFFRKALHNYYDTSVELLESEHASLRQMEHENAKALNAKGELSDENASSYEKLRKFYDNLYRGTSALAEALDMQLPVMPGDDASPQGAGRDNFVMSVGEAEPKFNENKTQEQLTAENGDDVDKVSTQVQANSRYQRRSILKDGDSGLKGLTSKAKKENPHVLMQNVDGNEITIYVENLNSKSMFQAIGLPIAFSIFLVGAGAVIVLQREITITRAMILALLSERASEVTSLLKAWVDAGFPPLVSFIDLF